MKAVINADRSYQRVEKQARHYFQLLNEQVTKKNYIPKLVDDFQEWKVNHIHHPSFFSLLSSRRKKPSSKDAFHYIKWLDYTNKLEDYLKRSISYIYLRDLGKTLDDHETQLKINHIVKDLRLSLVDSTKKQKKELFSLEWIIKKGKEEHILLTVDWLLNKLSTVSANIPKELDAVNAQRKLIKIIAGVILHTIDGFREGTSDHERKEKLDKAIRLGYCYGLTYPFIDDLLDSQLLSKQEKEKYSELIRISLITGNVPPLGRDWQEDTLQGLKYIHAELKEAFEYIQTQQASVKFFEQAFVFFHSQELDRQKELSNNAYTNEELYVPIILKSSSSRLIARSVIQTTDDDGFEKRTFLYGIYNQLADDFADMFEDLECGAVTPYTYFMQHQHHRNDLINPFEMYWAVISNLIHNVYHSDNETRELILNRAINGLKRFKEKHGRKKYDEVMKQFASGIPQVNNILQKMVDKADNVEFFDKLLRDHMIDHLKRHREEREAFKEKIQKVKGKVNQSLLIAPVQEDALFLADPILEAANYSLMGEGKRLRPIMAWFVGVEMYGLKEDSLVPLFRSLEFMHTASLVFDDLPSQDNAAYRRGRPTIHEMYNVAIAELTGLFLTQKAVEQQTLLEQFDTKTVLELIRYSAQVTANICKGQVMDLESKEKRLSKDELEIMCFHKTALGFEAALVMPAILAKVNERELEALMNFSRHAGIAFQIKDDLLDREGEFESLGKPAGLDKENHTSTFVTILGTEGAKIELWEQYCLAMEALESIPRNASFLKLFLNKIVHRDR